MSNNFVIGGRKRPAHAVGTGFYIARGRPFVTMKQYRERRRDPEAQIAVDLSRELTRLAGDFPRFRLALNQLQHHVLVQVRSPKWKQKTILACLPHEKGISVRELVRTSGLDFVSITRTLEAMRQGGEVITCTRAGQPLEVPATRTAKVYFRRTG
jgi:lambda repressor-like predicted transcriptional regulator